MAVTVVSPVLPFQSKYTELVSESIAVNTYILTVEATDADENRNAQLRYYLSGKGSDDFFINSTTGESSQATSQLWLLFWLLLWYLLWLLLWLVEGV